MIRNVSMNPIYEAEVGRMIPSVSTLGLEDPRSLSVIVEHEPAIDRSVYNTSVTWYARSISICEWAYEKTR